MKIIVLMAFTAIMAFTACNSNSNSKTAAVNGEKSSEAATGPTGAGNAASETPPLHEVLSAYLQIKNALANDNGQQAAAGGDAFVTAIEKLKAAPMNADQKKTYEENAGDAKEMAEHIGKSAQRIGHQREHFEMLSDDMYDLVKAFKVQEPLYKDFCPMYNNGKGASWISETKDIKNPYLGKKMPECGEVKEVIK